MRFDEFDEKMQSLTDHQLKIIQTIHNAGSQWLTRSKLARALGKRRLTPYDITCLTTLSEQEIIETSTQPTTAPGSDFAYIYHMSDEIANILQRWSEQRDSDPPAQERNPINLTDD
ncbi:MAG: hypothetical protein ACFE0Q_12540 [Anaerolineae bacterium]